MQRIRGGTLVGSSISGLTRLARLASLAGVEIVLAALVLTGAARAAFADGDTVKVPDVTGRTRADAVAALEGQGFLVATIEVAGTPPDTVESQIPPPGTDVPRTAPVTILVRRAVAISTTAPSALKLSVAEANAALGSVYNLKFVQVPGAEADRGTIVSQSPSGGQPLEFRGVLELRFVPDPSLSAKVTVPDVVGLSGADAEKAAAAAGLHARRAQAALPGTAADITIAQMPGPGTEVSRYGTVDLIVTIEPPAGTGSPPLAQTEVPNLTDTTESSARDLLGKAGLTATVEWVTGEPAKVFLVVSQDPGPTSKVPVGSPVKIRIVKYVPPDATPPTPSTVPVPNLIDLSQSQAEALLTSVGLVPNPVLIENSAVVPFRVYSQLLMPGTYVAPATTVTFRVAKPPPPSLPVPVPNFYGNTPSQALATAALAGLNLDIQYVTASGYPVNRVFSQSVSAYSTVPVGTLVQVRVAQWGGGGGTAVVPNLFGRTWGQANALLGSAGLGASGSYAYTASYPAYRVYQQNLPAGTPVSPGTVISFLVAKPPAAAYIVPNCFGMSQAGAMAAIAGAGLTPDINLVSGAPHPLWQVYWQSPAAGSNVPSGTIVHVKIATPGGPGLVQVPNLIGLTAVQANSALGTAGLGSSGSIVWAFGKPASRVYSQSYAPGAWVATGTVVYWKKQPP